MEIQPTICCPASDTMGCDGLVPLSFIIIPSQEMQTMKKHLEEMTQKTAALLHEYQNSNKDAPAVFQCSICFENHEVHGSCTLPCGHRFCFESLEQHFSLLVKERRLDSICCPVIECHHKVDDVEVLRGVLKETHVFQKLLEYMTRDMHDPNMLDCPKCEERIWVDDDDDRTNLICPQEHAFCADCVHGPHPFLSCAAKRESLCQEKKAEEFKETQRAQSIAMELGWKPCPKRCRFGGGFKASEECDHVTCQCGFEFCWMCGVDRDVLQAHDNRWHLTSCPYHTKRSEVKEDPIFKPKCPVCRSLGLLCPYPVDDGFPYGY